MKTALKVGFDFGASRVKASFQKGTEINDICFPNRVDADVDANGIKVTIDDTTLVVGTISGYSNSINKKINYRNVEHIIMAVAYKIKEELEILDDIIKLDINTVLPPTEFKESKDKYKELIKAVSGTKATVNGVTFTLVIDNVKVGAEGVALLNSYNLDRAAKDLNKVLLLDVGSSTTDIVILVKDGTWKIKDATSSRSAGSAICKAIQTRLNSGTGLSYTWDDLEREQSYQLDGEKHDIIKHINDADNVVEALISDLSRIDNVRQYKVILAGAGSRLLKESDLFKKYTKFACVDDNLLDFGNSRGALKA